MGCRGRVDAASVGAPKPATDLQAGTYKYKGKVLAGGQEIPLDLSTTIREENGMWKTIGTMQSPMGEATDTATLEKGTLLVRSRNVQQGPATISLDFTGNKAVGNVNMAGQDKPVSVNLGGPLFADAAGSGMVIGTLPLAEGYTTSFRNFDVRRQKEKLMQLTVVGTENVTVPAGTFDAFKVEVTPADGGADKETLWIAKDSRKCVKMSAVIADMGGATITQELLP